MVQSQRANKGFYTLQESANTMMPWLGDIAKINEQCAMFVCVTCIAMEAKEDMIWG